MRKQEAMEAPQLLTATSTLEAGKEPWAFTQQHPLTTSEFCKEAELRGIRLREEQLPDLWRVGALAPFLEIRRKRIHPGAEPGIPEPRSGGTWLDELRLARDSGRLADPTELGFRPQLRFSRPFQRSRPGWWNGLLYSHWQLLALAEFDDLVRDGKWGRRKGGGRMWRSRPLDRLEIEQANRLRELAALLVALEARYLPVLERPWVRLVNATHNEWNTFVKVFNPIEVLSRLNRLPDDLLRPAERLLLFIKRIDPLSGDWSELIRRAPQRAWEDLSGDALIALDRRIAAEVLLLCYEDLAEKGHVAPLIERTDLFNAQDARISHRSKSLDANLAALGISPHPGVVLVVEGETEEFFVPRVRDRVRIPGQSEVVQSVVLRGVTRDLTKLAALACAPLIEEKLNDSWLIVKPPTRLMVVIDPDRPFDTPTGVEEQRQKIVDEIIAVVRAQGVEPKREDIDALISITTWPESCFEFAHFEDEELAEALFKVHPQCGGLDKAALVRALAEQRRHRQDIKNAWRHWPPPQPSKLALAHELWPILLRKLDAADRDSSAPLPPIAKALIDAFRAAIARPHGRFAIRGTGTTS